MAISLFVLSPCFFFTTVFVPRDVLLAKGKGGEKIATFRIYFEVVNRLVAASHSRGTKLPCWRANVALRQDKQKANIILDNCLCLSCPSVTFALQHGGFVPRECLAAKGLFVTPLSGRSVEKMKLLSRVALA